ncbi:MAG: hypothetical protein WCJ61_01835, partial [Paludibacter sp.]
MAIIDIYIRTQSKTKALVKLRFRLRDKSLVLNYTSDIEISPKIWDANKQKIKNTKQVDANEKIMLEKKINDRKNLLLSIYQDSNEDDLDSDGFNKKIETALNPVKPIKQRL